MENGMENETNGIETLRDWIESCAPESMVFFGGAGVSTESGIPDFRGSHGLYKSKYGDMRPEEMLSRSYFDADPQGFFDFYFAKMIFRGAEPNQAHRKLAELEREGILDAVITQNIDGLHQAAGSKNVIELHGSVLRNYCMHCGKFFDLDGITQAHESSVDGVPRCDVCSGIIKPDVVLYEEPLDNRAITAAVNAIDHADLLVIAGTSLAVYPAAGLIDYFSGSHLVIINRDPTPQDGKADLCLAANVGTVFDF